jgi:hypothetical protein
MGWGLPVENEMSRSKNGRGARKGRSRLGFAAEAKFFGKGGQMKTKIVLILLGLFAAASIAWAAAYKVITQEAVVRKDKRFFAPSVTRVPYGETVQEKERQGDWLRVSYRGAEGWLHISAVQEQKFRLSDLAGERAQESTKEEVALAGKGFTPEVEKAFRDKNANMRYDLVNQVQSYKISESQIQDFIRVGNLKEPGGAP